MYKMRYFNNKFSKITNRWGLSALSAPLTFDFGDLKLRDFSKLSFFKRIMTKLSLIKISYDVIDIASSKTLPN